MGIRWSHGAAGKRQRARESCWICLCVAGSGQRAGIHLPAWLNLSLSGIEAAIRGGSRPERGHYRCTVASGRLQEANFRNDGFWSRLLTYAGSCLSAASRKVHWQQRGQSGPAPSEKPDKLYIVIIILGFSTRLGGLWVAEDHTLGPLCPSRAPGQGSWDPVQPLPAGPPLFSSFDLY